MGKLIDLTGKQFNHLTVISRADNNVLPSGLKEPMWNCLCDCGNTTVVRGAFLRSGHTGSCGCHQTGDNFVDHTGHRFNHLTVIRRVENEIQPNGNTIPRYLCKCDCGNEIVTRGSSLLDGHTKSCGCRKKQLRIKDMIGQKFGKLTVVSRADDYNNPNGTIFIMWNCVCDCGVHTVVRGTSLRDGHCVSCGCYRLEQLSEKPMSKAELWTVSYFDRLGVVYFPQKSYPGLKGVGGGLLSYDFLVWIDDKPKVLIECHGTQHYEVNEYFGGIEQFNRQQIHDELKRQHAINIGLPLIEIPYDGDKEIDFINKLENSIFDYLK